MMDPRYNEYISFLTQYKDELSSFLVNEREKRRALLGNDMDKLSGMLKVQQAETMKFRNMEAKRLRLQLELGLPDEKAAELLKKAGDAETRSRLQELFGEISDIAEQIREQNGQSLELAKASLRAFDAVSRGAEEEAGNRVYGPDSRPKGAYSAGRTFEETV